ncbi:MAG: hypothetical protein CVU84_10250 [Firmicutes bacterium HGW-Firmicutes-1]|jgi:uncharacterized membrane protein|nr:MAG: hypothetical protein CVU84_10250 [Firmicutes bacterium HGW-Firmicutes-1]
MSTTNNKSILKLLIGLIIIIFGLYLINTLFSGSVTSGGGYMYMGSGASYGSAGTISLILLLLIKILFVLFIVGLVVGILVAVTRYLLNEEDVKTIKGTFNNQKIIVIKETCTLCGKQQHKDWKVCPYCGQEIEKSQTLKEVEVYE